MIDRVRLTFAALREAGVPAAGGIAVRLLPEAGDGVYLALDGEGRSHLLIRTVTPGDGSTGMATVSLHRSRLGIGGETHDFVDVRCEVDALSEVFDHFVVAVAERLPNHERQEMVAVLEVVEHWRRFLVKASEPAGRERLASVFGELLVLLDLVRADPQRRVDCWVGPFGGRHDLRRGGQAIEVKTTRAHTSRVVTIHGEDQLLEPEDGVLHLHLVRLEEVPEGGASVPSLVDDLLAAGAATSSVFEALAAAGIPPADFEAASTARFDVRERLTVPIDEAAPRIVPSSFAAGARPVGTSDITYRLDVDHLLERSLDATAWSALVAALAGGGAAA